MGMNEKELIENLVYPDTMYRKQIEDLEQQLQAYKDKEDKIREYCESNRGYVQGYGFVYREDEKLQEVKNDILEILGE